MSDEQIAPPAYDADPRQGDPDETPHYGVVGFSIRELALAGVWLVAFVVSFFPVYTHEVGALLGGGSVWTTGIDWMLTIGVPTIAVFLLVLRRLSPSGIRRVGSLGIDQFASVAFSVSAVVWLTTAWATVALMIPTGVWIRTWVLWVELVLALAGVVLTVAAPVIPPFARDFERRAEIVAHRNARPVRELEVRPAAPRPVPPPAAAPAEPLVSVVPAGSAEPAGTAEPPVVDLTADSAAAYAHDSAAYSALGFADTAAQPRVEEPDGRDQQDGQEEHDAEPAPHYARSGGYARRGTDAEPPVQQAFWALSPTERDVHDERGAVIFQVGPTAWALVLEDRGGVFVVRHEDGRIGYLHDVTGVTRG